MLESIPIMHVPHRSRSSLPPSINQGTGEPNKIYPKR
jgi:hypothetical protein